MSDRFASGFVNGVGVAGDDLHTCGSGWWCHRPGDRSDRFISVILPDFGCPFLPCAPFAVPPSMSVSLFGPIGLGFTMHKAKGASLHQISSEPPSGDISILYVVLWVAFHAIVAF